MSAGQAELAGTLRERVAIERLDPGRDEAGAPAGSWRAVGSLWAAVTPEPSGRSEAGEALSVAPRWRVVVRSPCEVTLDDRLGWGARRLRVRGIGFDPRTADRVTLACEEERG